MEAHDNDSAIAIAMAHWYCIDAVSLFYLNKLLLNSSYLWGYLGTGGVAILVLVLRII